MVNSLPFHDDKMKILLLWRILYRLTTIFWRLEDFHERSIFFTPFCRTAVAFKILSRNLALGRRKLIPYTYLTFDCCVTQAGLPMSLTRIASLEDNWSWSLVFQSLVTEWLRHNLIHTYKTHKTLPEYPSVQNLLADNCVIFIRKYSNQVIRYFSLTKSNCSFIHDHRVLFYDTTYRDVWKYQR